MSLPPSSFARNTPTTTVPPTQNTAPVLKFRCLFTHDLRRKAKRWQDGFLRFHTFNKRVMVYDDAGNFIGDHHWRESGDLQDGDELELDKGVLIQVGECMEKTQTDISALFEKRRASQESPTQQKPVLPPSSRVSLSSQSAPLKSLNDLLGINRPSIGRSFSPQSPYEQRHAQSHRSDDLGEEVRPAKRQKQQPPEVLQGRSTNEPLRSRPVVIDLEKSPSRELRAAKLLPTPQPSEGENMTANAKKADSGLKVPPLLAQAPQSLPKKPSENGTPPSTATRSIDTHRAPEKADPMTTTPTNPLRILSEKPRQKLIYRALLPPKPSNKGEPAETGQTRQVHSYDSHVTDSGGGPYSNTEFAVSDATLALFDELMDDNTATKRVSLADKPPKESPSQVQKRTLYSIPRHSTGNDPNEETTPQPQPARPRKSNPNTTIAEKSAALARSSSDLAGMIGDSRPVASAQENPVAANPAVTTKRSEPKIFRKSLSDTTALRNGDSNQHRHQQPVRPVATKGPSRGQFRNNNDDENGEKGPWTSEALDFFDWWPPGRPKPKLKPT